DNRRATEASANPSKDVFGAAAGTPDEAADGFIAGATAPVSVLPVTAGNASLVGVRRALSAGQRPPRDEVRIEELLQSFAAHAPAPASNGAGPFAAWLDVAQAPWAPA